jgi:REP element-mobilizing transposase RayT
LFRIIRNKCLATREVLLLEFGGTADHVHLAVKVPPSLGLPRWIGELKGASTYEINGTFKDLNFSWQIGYGIVSFAEKDRKIIENYINNQELHHSTGKLYPNLEKINDLD